MGLKGQFGIYCRESRFKGIQGRIHNNYLNRLNLVTVPRLEPESERRYKIPRILAQPAPFVPHSTAPTRAQGHIFSIAPDVPARLKLGRRA
jgi:hypothetical protein